jgi:hypothetical protein
MAGRIVTVSFVPPDTNREPLLRQGLFYFKGRGVSMRTNVAEKKALIYTHGGAVAVFTNPVDQLRRSVMSCLLWEDEFYEDGQSIAKRIQETTAEILKQKNGADTVANIAY